VTPHEWLSEVLLSLAFRLGGWSGVVLLTGAAAALAALIVGLSTARELRGTRLIATVAIGVSLLTANRLRGRTCWRSRPRPPGAQASSRRAIAAARRRLGSLCS
jgi:hypothetical protein